MSTPRKQHLLPLTALIMTAQGCAVLTIDVDVYKGPLLNQRSVQTEQVIGMASAAKPLLVALREQVENEARVKTRHPSLQDDISPGENPLGYLDPLSPRTKTLRFHSKPALHINEILALYSSDGDPAIARMAQEIQLAKTQFDTAKRQFDKPYKNEALKWLPTAPIDSGAPDEATQQLAKAYRLFLENGTACDTRCAEKILNAHNAVADLAKAGGKHISFPNIEQGSRPARIAFPTFTALRQRSTVSVHADWLKIPETEREAFIDTVTSIAQAFFSIADAQAHMWRTTLPLLARTLSTQANSNTQQVSEEEAALGKIRRYLIQTTAIRILHCAINVVSPEQTVGSEVRAIQVGWATRLKGVFHEVNATKIDPCNLSWGGYKEASNTNVIYERLLDLLRNQPGQAVRDLLDADSYARSDSQVNENIDRRQYGIVLIPEKHPDNAVGQFTESIAKLSTDSVASLGALKQGGLSYRGLIPGGLDTLLREYLAIRLASPMDDDTTSTPPNHVKEKQQALLHALVHFADSLVTTANYVKLLDREGQQSCFTFLSIIPIPYWECPAKHNLDEYVSVLQAIGNSILFQVDEIRRRDAAKTTNPSGPILPMPAAILRSSMPATTLQVAPKNLGANMLDELKSSLEDIRQLIIRSQTEHRDLLLEELDKQAWQRINQVKVRGVGRTNYVVAKDDIGNWYVKNFESKPDKIFESARNLASFGLSTGLTPASAAAKSLLSGRNQEDQSAAVDSLIAGTSITLKADLEKITQKLSTDRNRLRYDLPADLSKDDLLKDRITDIKNALLTDSPQSHPFPSECADFFDDARLLCEELYTTKEYAEALQTKLHNIAFSQDTDVSIKDAVRKKIDNKTADFLNGKFNDWTSQTKAAFQKYERTLQPLSQ